MNGRALSSGPRRSAATGQNGPPHDWKMPLLKLSLELRIDNDLRSLTRYFLDGLSPLMPSFALGVCVAESGESEPIVEISLPDPADSQLGRDPTRLFPYFSVERILPLVGDSTLHVATQGASLEEWQPVIATAADVLGTALSRARRFRESAQAHRDLTRLQAQVIQAEKLASLGQIVAGVVHELNNPLTSIVAYAEYLRRKALGRDISEADRLDDVERLNRISEAAERILRFSRDLVDYARPAVDIPGAVSLGAVLDKALVFCDHEFSVNNVHVERQYAANLPKVRGIPGQLTQVFVNLFTNAAHAMTQHGGTLRIHAHLDESCQSIQVAVQDDGEGIAREDIAHVFEPFFTTKSDGRGTGLGLSIVRDIVLAHGGQVSAESTPGRGTVLHLVLPIAVAPPSLLPPA